MNAPALRCPDGRGWRGAITHCAHGHEYTPENTRWRYDMATPQRACRECERRRAREYVRRVRG